VQTTKAYLQVKHARIFYETAGKGEPLLLLHGGFGTVEDFHSQIPELSKHFRVVAFERPGHGHSADTNGAFHFDTMSEYTIGFIEALELGPTNIMGWSDGAAIALLVSIRRPDLVKRLISVGGFFNTNSASPQDQDWIRSATPESFKKSMPTLVKRYDDASPDGPAHFPIVFEKTRKLWLTEPNIAKEELAKITAPTLLMVGDRDATIPEHTLELFRSIKGAQLSVIPGASHFFLSEKSTAANRVILEFLLADANSNK
jgi:pimeloyl-ACP methyl ester carboxylesterase